MNVNVVSIDQSYELATGAVSNFAVLELSSGKRIRIPLSDEDTSLLISESTSDLGGGYESEEVEAGAMEAAAEVLRQAPVIQDISETDSDWTDPSNILDFDVEDGPRPTPIENPASPINVVNDYAETPVYEHHVEEGVVEWEKLPDTQLPPSMKDILRKSKVNPFISVADLDALKAQILEHMAKKPKPGKVNWNEGPKRAGAAKDPWANMRTVNKDEAGNPLPPGGIVEADPGEDYDDDDGVSQL